MQRPRRALTLSLIALGLACTLASCGGEPPVLRFDGLYRAAPSQAYGKYLRFFEDGSVVSASSTSEPAAVAKWLTETHENRGTWSREEGVLRFTCTGPSGTVDYEGEVLASGLQLRVHSHINDYEGEASYEFVMVDAPGETP